MTVILNYGGGKDVLTMTWKHLDRNLLKNGIMKKIPFCHRKSPLHQKGTCGGSVKKVIHGEQQFQAEGN